MPYCRTVGSITALRVAGILSLLLVASLAIAQSQQKPQFDTTEVADGVYSFRFMFHRSLFIVTDDGVITIDPLNPKAAQILMAEIKNVTDKPVKYVLYSHEHWDHIAGGQVFKEAGATFVSHANCVAEFENNPIPIVVMPDETYDGDRLDITLGGRTVEMHYVGRNHGNCMSVMRLPKEKLLFIVDLVTPKRIAFRNMPDFYPLDWVRSLKRLEELDVTHILPAHGPAKAPASAIREMRVYLEDLMAAVKEVRKTERNPDKVRTLVKLPKYEKWGGYDQWLEMNVDRINFYYHMGK